MGDNNLTELMTVNNKMFKLIIKRSRLKLELATVSQEVDVLRERQRKHWWKTHYRDSYRVDRKVKEKIDRCNENCNLVRTALQKTNGQIARLSAQLDEGTSNLQLELNSVFEIRQECVNYAVKHYEAYKRSCLKMDKMYETFQKSEKSIAELQKIIQQKMKEYELMNSPLSKLCSEWFNKLQNSSRRNSGAVKRCNNVQVHRIEAWERSNSSSSKCKSWSSRRTASLNYLFSVEIYRFPQAVEDKIWKH